MAVLTVVFAACSGTPIVEIGPGPSPTQSPVPSPTPSATPQIAVTASPLPGENLNASPTGTDDSYSPDELNGVAGPEDNLPILDSYKEAKAINSDVIGWITIDGTVIDYPVVRGTDNNFYLGRNVEKEKSRFGSIFMDFRNAESYQQRHIIIYGHNMKNGTMFHDLTNFKQKDFFDAHRTIQFYWDGVETEWQVYLAYIVMPNTIYHIHVRFADDQEFADIMNQTIEYAKTVKPMNYDSSVTIKPTDQVLTLSTCTYEYDDSYFAVMAKRVK
ncbi:MAG TPA: class B sortase [Clostridia bacterium]|nr:class B sortase [Clostridia bacterium]